MNHLKNRTLQAHLCRAFTSPTLYLCIVLYVLLASFPLLEHDAPPTAMQFLWETHTSGLQFVMVTVIPAWTYAVVYVDDYDTRLLYVWVVRSGQKAYALSYYATALISAFTVSFVSNTLSIGVCVLQGIPVIQTDPFKGTMFQAYELLQDQGYFVLYVLAVLAEYALGASVMAGLAAAFSTLTHRRLMTLCLPIFYFFLSTTTLIISKNFPELGLQLHPMLNIDNLIRVSYFFADGWPLANFLYKLLTCAIHWVICGMVVVCTIERSVKNA